MPSPITLPEISEAERTPLVEQLMGLIETLAETNQRQAEVMSGLRSVALRRTVHVDGE